ncbi:hypothetical protein C8A05DRAFT_16668 [Staphylotrichum tortipilum]|uniref:Tyrosinase copper-binding domain-containing protein n=1 Tax=Staphylotrichum tortipilum TaxID=2831512 RepID=A0AAN6MHS8_9PEZI|nr:hypothetical protein C8A05DRAFT_16668 [Staphylotrichum longicolle]
MWRASICVAGTLFALAWAGAQPAPSPSGTPFPVVGVKTGIDKSTGQPPARLNINTLWARGGPQWDLFILAFAELQALDETNELSYFGITGIHGFPHSAWNGVCHVDGAPITGFCPHGQVLVSHAAKIAVGYPPDIRTQYVTAVQTLRLPYWDWASDPTLPPAVYASKFTVRAPGGIVDVPNPLAGYQFQRPAVKAGFGGFLATFPQTIRCLGEGGMLSNITASNERMTAAAQDITGSVYDIFARPKPLASTSSRISDFEFPHNLVHALAVCNGTLSDLNCMLHHCNVDRLVAMWQAINYNESMYTGTAYSTGQYATVKNTPITAASPLKPFFDEHVTFYTSGSVSNTTSFGYTYPEIPNSDMPPDSRAGHVRARVNSLYGGGDNGLGQMRTNEMDLPAMLRLVVDGSVVGRWSLLAMPPDGVAQTSMPLQDVSIGNRSIRDIDPAEVILFLEKHMTTEIRRSDGTQISPASVPSLQIHVQSMEYMPRADDSSFPSLGNATDWPVRGAAVARPRAPPSATVMG